MNDVRSNDRYAGRTVLIVVGMPATFRFILQLYRTRAPTVFSAAGT